MALESQLSPQAEASAGRQVLDAGIGATGIQVIQTIADKVAELKVFVRTPQYVLPMKNPSYGPEEVAAYKARFEELRQTLPNTFTGFEYDFDRQWKDLTPEQRRAHLEDCYANGSLKLWLASFGEMFFDPEVSEQVSEFVREKMRARLKDPRLCELLIPTDYGFGTHRVPLEMNYLEVYLRPNVEAVPVKDNAIARITPEGIELADGTRYDLDVIILARPHATCQGWIHDLKKQVACAIIHMFQKLCHIMNAQILQSLQQFPQSCMRCTLCHARDNAKVRLIEARAILGRQWIKCVHAAGWVPHIRWEISHQLLVQCLGHIRYNDMAVHTHTDRAVCLGKLLHSRSSRFG